MVDKMLILWCLNLYVSKFLLIYFCFIVELKYFQSAPFTEEDNRVNNYVPSNDVKYKLVCGSTNLLKFMPWDTHLYHISFIDRKTN